MLDTSWIENTPKMEITMTWWLGFQVRKRVAVEIVKNGCLCPSKQVRIEE